MGQKSIILTIGLIIFAVIFGFVFLISRVNPSSNKKGSTPVSIVAAKKTVSVTDIVTDPLVYEGITVETESPINDWVTKNSFTVTTTSQTGGFLGNQQVVQLLVVRGKPFSLPDPKKPTVLGLGETVNVHMKGRVLILNRDQLASLLNVDLDGDTFKLDDNTIADWKLGSVLLLDSVEKIQTPK